MRQAAWLITIVLLVFLAAPVYGHGLAAEFDGIRILTGDERFRVKVTSSPGAIEFVRPNILKVAIIDTEKGGHFYGDVKIYLKRAGDKPYNNDLPRNVFKKGFFETRVNYMSEGRYDLMLHIKNPEIDRVFNVTLDIKDRRTLSLIIAAVAVAFFTVFPGAIYFMLRRRIPVSI